MRLSSIDLVAPRLLLCAIAFMAVQVPDGMAAEGVLAVPLKARMKRNGARLFAPVEAAESGLSHAPQVHNDNPLSYMYHSGFVCGGVAVGDVDGDGQLDLFFGGAAEKNRLYRGLGDLKFEEITDETTGGMGGGERWTTGVSLVDVDGDRDLDVFLCNYESPNQLFLNDGRDGKGRLAFREVAAQAGLAAVDSSHSAYFCDYDRDGDLDLFLLTNRVEDPQGTAHEGRSPVVKEGNNYRLKPEFERYYALWQLDQKTAGNEPTGRPDLLYRNDGPGADGVPKFTDVTKAAGISGRGDGLSATWWDYNQDGWPDIYVGNDFLSEDRLWRNNGDGTFTNALPDAVPHTCWFSMGADQGDLNNDLLPDFLIADMAATTHYKSKTTMGAMGGVKLQRAVTSHPPQYMRNTCLIGTGAGRFLEAAYLLGIASTDWTWAIKFADFDLDGWQDIYVTNGIIRGMNHSDQVLREEETHDKHLWDFYKDREPRPEQHRAYRNEQHLHFADVSGEWGLDRTAITYGCATADFDGDGDMDLVEVNLGEPPTLYRNNATEGNVIVFTLEGAGANTAGYGARVVIESASGKQMRQLFPQSGYHSQNEAVLHFGLGNDKTVTSAVVTWANGAEQILTGLAAGQRCTVRQPAGAAAPVRRKEEATLFVKAETFPSVVHNEVPFDDFAGQILLPHAMSRLGPALAWGDVNGDGLTDLFAGGGAEQAGELRLADGKGGFAAQWVDALRDDKACEDMGAVFFDADGDGDLDLFVASGSSQFKQGDARQRDRLYLNDGKGGLTRAVDALPDLREAGGSVCAADFDRDGDVDIYAGSRSVPGDYPETPVSRLLRNDTRRGKVKFTDATEETGGAALLKSGMVSGALWSDINGDGWQDLVLAHEWGPVRLFLNHKGKLAERRGAADDLAQNTGWWLSAETADLDGDGDLDIVAGNFGYNTKYKEATKEKPKLIYYADFDGTGNKDIVEVKREGDILYPERGRSCSSTAMPFLRQKFPTYETFARATLGEIYGDKLKQAEKFEANTLGTGIFWNEGNDAAGAPKFRYEALERLAQVAPAFGLTVSDFDGDGRPDLFLAQNFHSPQIETGHYDGGLGQLLLNRSHGHFVPVAAGRSGIVVPGDAKAATVCDLNGDAAPDLLVSVNGGHLEALKAAAGNGRWLRVSLPGADAAGAKVRLTRAGQPDQIAEYHAGSGYLSQSPPVLTFGLGDGPAEGEVTVTWADGWVNAASFASAAEVVKFVPPAAK